MPKSARQAQIEQAALYPLDWVEERTGLVGYTKWFLFRHVPRDVNWMQTLGAATLTAFLVQAVTGVVLAMYYKPDPNSAYESIQFISNELTLGWLVDSLPSCKSRRKVRSCGHDCSIWVPSAFTSSREGSVGVSVRRGSGRGCRKGRP